MHEHSKIDHAVARYRRFLANLASVPRPHPAPYYKTFKGISLHGAALPFSWFSSDALREIANTINDFGRNIGAIRAWHPIFEEADVPEKHEILIDHIRPLAVLCLGAPQAIRGRLIHAATASSHHANIFLDREPNRPSWNGAYVSMSIARKVSRPWSSWPALSAALTSLGDDEFGQATGMFRNEHEHGHPRSIGIGNTRFVRRIDPANSAGNNLFNTSDEEIAEEVWTIGSHEPLDIADLLPLFDKQCELALAAFGAYHDLLTEQLAASPPLPDTEGSGESVTFEGVPSEQ